MRWVRQGCSDHQYMSFDWIWHFQQSPEWPMGIKNRYRQWDTMKSSPKRAWGTGGSLGTWEQQGFLKGTTRSTQIGKKAEHTTYRTLHLRAQHHSGSIFLPTDRMTFLLEARRIQTYIWGMSSNPFLFYHPHTVRRHTRGQSGPNRSLGTESVTWPGG